MAQDREWVDVTQDWHLTQSKTSYKLTNRPGTMAKTLAHRAELLKLLRSPPAEFDGSNAMLAKLMRISIRTLIRTMNALKAEGLVRTQKRIVRLDGGKVRTIRFIQVKEG
jgi:hypothetical protein